MAWKRPVIIVGIGGVSVALLVGLAMASIGILGPVSRMVALMLALLFVLVVSVGFGAFVILSGDAIHLRRLTRVRDGLCPGCGRRPAPLHELHIRNQGAARLGEGPPEGSTLPP